MFKKFCFILFFYALILLLPVFFLRSAHAVTDTSNLVSGVDYSSPISTTLYNCSVSVVAAKNQTTYDSSKYALNYSYPFNGAPVFNASGESKFACFDALLKHVYSDNFGPYYHWSQNNGETFYICPDKYASLVSSASSNTSVYLSAFSPDCSSSTSVGSMNFPFTMSSYEGSACSDPAFPIADTDLQGNQICLSINHQCKQYKDVSVSKWLVSGTSGFDSAYAFHEKNVSLGEACLGNCAASVSRSVYGSPLIGEKSYYYTYTGTGEACSLSDEIGVSDFSDTEGCTATDCNSAPNKPDGGQTCYIDDNGVYYCYTPTADDDLPFNCSYDSAGEVVCNNFDDSAPSNCIDFDGQRTCYNSDGTTVPKGKLPDNCIKMGDKLVCATSQTNTDTIDKDGDGKPDSKTDGTKSGVTTTGTITTNTDGTQKITLDTEGLSNDIKGVSDKLGETNGKLDGIGDALVGDSPPTYSFPQSGDATQSLQQAFDSDLDGLSEFITQSENIEAVSDLSSRDNPTDAFFSQFAIGSCGVNLSYPINLSAGWLSINETLEFSFSCDFIGTYQAIMNSICIIYMLLNLINFIGLTLPDKRG